MLLLTFSKTGQEDIILTEDDLFDFDYEENAYSGETFELGSVCAKSIYMMIDNNAQRFSRGTFANTRIKLEIDGNFYGYFNAELPKRRNGVIELNAYDDMVKLDVAFPSDVLFPALFKQAYAYCTVAAGLAQEFSYDNVVLNGVWDNGVITYEYNDYIYANSCRNLVSGMAEWNGGFAHINSDGKLQVDKFSKTVSREYNSGDLFEFDYSDDTVIFTKVKTSQKNKTYEKGDDSGYTLVLNNQYISYGLDDEAFETYLTLIYDYYNGFSLTPMSFVLAEPDFQLHVGDRIQVYDEEEQVTITGNVSKIEISGNCSMKVTCGGFENVSSSSNFTPTSYNQIAQSKTEAVQNAVSTSTAPLNQYEYLTDLSAKCNGVTYTVEKDDTTGLISKISDSNGNEFEPTVNSGITDTAFHNAVIMAVAMIRGIHKTLTEQQFILNVCSKGDTANYPIMCYFITDTKYQALLLKSSYALGLGLWRPVRNGIFACVSLEPSGAVYRVTDGAIDRWADSPLKLASSNSSLGFSTNKHNTMYISAAPAAMHQFFSSWFEAGVELDIKSHPISFSDMFSFSGVGAPTGAIYYKWNDYFFVDFYYNGEFAVLDDTNLRLDRGSTAKNADLSSYVPSEGYYHALGTSKVSVSYSSAAQYGTSYYSTLRNNLEGNIFFNTEDIRDENGNVLLAKNCDISFFV